METQEREAWKMCGSSKNPEIEQKGVGMPCSGGTVNVDQTTLGSWRSLGSTSNVKSTLSIPLDSVFLMSSSKPIFHQNTRYHGISNGCYLHCKKELLLLWWPFRFWNNYPALKVTCNKCAKKGDYARLCESKTPIKLNGDSVQLSCFVYDYQYSL